MKIKNLALAAATSVVALAGAANAHVWNIGWESSGGNLTFYGVSYHNSLSSNDNFVLNPAGFIVNGTNLSFETGSVVDLEDNFGVGGITAGSVSAKWNALGLDGALAGSSYGGGSTYGKYATATITAANLVTYGLNGGAANNVSLTTFANNVHWDGVTFGTGTVNLNIVITPPSAVPVPAALPMAAAGFGLLGFIGRRKKRKAAA